MNESIAFFSGVQYSILETLDLVTRGLDAATISIIAHALQDEWRIVLVGDESGDIVIALFDERSGRIGPLLGSVNDRGHERTYRLQHAQIERTNGKTAVSSSRAGRAGGL